MSGDSSGLPTGPSRRAPHPGDARRTHQPSHSGIPAARIPPYIPLNTGLATRVPKPLALAGDSQGSHPPGLDRAAASTSRRSTENPQNETASRGFLVRLQISDPHARALPLNAGPRRATHPDPGPDEGKPLPSRDGGMPAKPDSTRSGTARYLRLVDERIPESPNPPTAVSNRLGAAASALPRAAAPHRRRRRAYGTHAHTGGSQRCAPLTGTRPESRPHGNRRHPSPTARPPIPWSRCRSGLTETAVRPAKRGRDRSVGGADRSRR